MKKLMMVVVMLFAMVGVVHAANVTGVEWDAPTTRVDGTALDALEIAKYTVYCGAQITTVPAPATTTSLANVANTLSDGTISCSVTVTDVFDLQSDHSNAVVFVKKGANFFGPSATAPGKPAFRLK